MSKQLLLGDEAIAQAALDAGLSGVYAYPGTPSTEITEYIQMAPITTEQNIHNRWCANEKTAMEAALGMSFVGKRALVCMKHVGMNVAADCFVNSAITGVKGGLIVIAADDPSMHSSQNEQDSRFYGDFSLIPMYEPSNQQEAYDMVYNGFEFSEKTGEPILMRMVTRLAHSRSGVERKEQKPQNSISFSEDPRQFILLPGNARKRYKVLLARQDEFIKASEESPYNKYIDGPNKKLGIVACGIGYNYLMENYPEGCEYPVLKIGQYPLPKKQLLQLVESCDEILVLEDGQPFVEKHLKGYLGIGIKVKGRLDGTLSQDGELNPDSVARAVGKENKSEFGVPSVVEMRPPALCEGCGHRDMYVTLTEVLKEGSEEESTEALRERFLFKVQKPSTSGNIYDYYNWTIECAGVGAAKIYPLALGPGTVKVVIADAERSAATPELIEQVKNHIEELRPIGADVSVVSAREKAIAVTARVRLQNGVNLGSVQEMLMLELTNFLQEGAFDVSYVSLAKVGNLLLNTTGVEDFTELRLNGQGANVSLADEEIAVAGAVALEVMQ